MEKSQINQPAVGNVTFSKKNSPYLLYILLTMDRIITDDELNRLRTFKNVAKLGVTNVAVLVGQENLFTGSLKAN